MSTAKFYQKQYEATGEAPIRITEWPVWKELEILKNKIMFANGSWYCDRYSWRTDGEFNESFDVIKDLETNQFASEETKNEHRLGNQKFQMLYRETWIDKLSELFESLQRALLCTGPMFKWPSLLLKVEDPGGDGEAGLKLLKKLRAKHQRELRLLERSEPLKSYIEELEAKENYKRESLEKSRRVESDRKFQLLNRLSEIKLED